MSDTQSHTRWPKLLEVATKIVGSEGYGQPVFTTYTPEQRLIAAAIIDTINNETYARTDVTAWIEALASARKAGR